MVKKSNYLKTANLAVSLGSNGHDGVHTRCNDGGDDSCKYSDGQANAESEAENNR